MDVPRTAGHFASELEAKAEKLPDTCIVIFENDSFPEEVLTYANMVKMGRKLARALADHGIGKGDTFALLMRNHPEFVYSLYATSILGAVLVPIDPRSRAERIRFMLSNSGSKGLIFTSEFLENVEEAVWGLPSLKVVGIVCKDGMDTVQPDRYPSVNEILCGPEAPPPDRVDYDIRNPMEIIYTSGTTGDPKGVVLKGTRLAPYAKLFRGVFGYSDDDRLYTGLSLTHGNAQAVTLIPSVFLGIPSVISRKFTKSRIWDVCSKYGCTTFSLLGGMMMGIYSEPAKPRDADNPVRLVISAGTPRPIWEAFEKRFGVLIHEWYGAVEGGFAHKPPGVGPIGSFGKPLEGVTEMMVVREDGIECLSNEMGEIVCRNLAEKTEVEYVGKKEASEAKTRGGWLRTGDVGHKDENGWFFFDYRKGGGLRRSGDFIQPDYVEAAIAEHPDVSDVCVYGIPAESGAPGESDLVAAVVVHEGCSINPASLFRFLKEKLEKNSIPSYLQMVKDIPKTVSEKNLDRVLKEEFRKDALGVFPLSDMN